MTAMKGPFVPYLLLIVIKAKSYWAFFRDTFLCPFCDRHGQKYHKGHKVVYYSSNIIHVITSKGIKSFPPASTDDKFSYSWLPLRHSDMIIKQFTECVLSCLRYL